jgi:hypothetical protein
MPRQGAIVRHDDVTAELAVVSDVCVAHKQIVMPDARGNFLMCAAVHRGVLAKNIMIADFQVRGLADILQILRFPTNHRKREKLIVRTDATGSLDDHVGMQYAAVAKNNAGTDDAIGTDREIDAQNGIGRNDGSRMNHDR